jgi:hypothetical protein
MYMLWGLLHMFSSRLSENKQYAIFITEPDGPVDGRLSCAWVLLYTN